MFTIREDILHEIKALSQNLIFSQLLFGRVAKEVKGEQLPAAVSGSNEREGISRQRNQTELTERGEGTPLVRENHAFPERLISRQTAATAILDLIRNEVFACLITFNGRILNHSKIKL